MNISQQLSLKTNSEYITPVNLDLYNAPHCQELATQAASGRHLRLLSSVVVEGAIQIQLCEDDYISWLPVDQLEELTLASTPYQAVNLSRSQIEAKIPDIIAFTDAAMKESNYYLWGGTIGPNYDCSGLMQGAFAASGIWIPRDSYQQEEFTKTIAQELLEPGDLIFFGQQKVNHVALYLGDGYYIHSSGKERGRNGIGIDQLSQDGDEISCAYYQDLWSFGRVMNSYSSS
jgi:cell wall-associated NlpC family hydrolase